MPGVRWGIALAVGCALAAGGCGSSDNATPKLTRGEADALVVQLERARLTAAAHDLAGTTAALRGFRASVARLRSAGAISAATAAALRIGAVRALDRATSDSTPPVQTETTPAPAPAPEPKKEKHPPKHGKPHDKKGKDD